MDKMCVEKRKIRVVVKYNNQEIGVIDNELESILFRTKWIGDPNAHLITFHFEDGAISKLDEMGNLSSWNIFSETNYKLQELVIAQSKFRIFKRKEAIK